ncbi:hypothetical protein ACFPRL_36345 [Pseudoclavibacter helvolus]
MGAASAREVLVRHSPTDKPASELPLACGRAHARMCTTAQVPMHSASADHCGATVTHPCGVLKSMSARVPTPCDGLHVEERMRYPRHTTRACACAHARTYTRAQAHTRTTTQAHLCTCARRGFMMR